MALGSLLERQRPSLHPFSFFFGDQLAQFLGRVNHAPGGRVFDLRPPQVVAEPMDVLTRLACQFILDSPNFLKNRIRFHKQNLP